jgi:predicted dehydrogenase
VGSLDGLLGLGLDGVVIATPSALHAEQASAALAAGAAVFCQKPLARTARETRRVVAAARGADRLLGVDFSYRRVAGVSRMRELVQSGELGEVFAATLVFHNAYGPDKAWFYDHTLSGGGCAIDLGIHLLDLALWVLGERRVAEVRSRLYAKGKLLGRPVREVEDYAVADVELASGTAVSLACSWRLNAGQDAAIEASFYGSRGGVSLRNVNGSFYDFTVERFSGTARETLARPPDAWGGRAATDWAEALASGRGFDPAIEDVVGVAQIIDALYGRA